MSYSKNFIILVPFIAINFIDKFTLVDMFICRLFSTDDLKTERTEGVVHHLLDIHNSRANRIEMQWTDRQEPQLGVVKISESLLGLVGSKKDCLLVFIRHSSFKLNQ